MTQESEGRILEATVAQTTYRNDENGYTVLQVRQGKEYVTVVGVMPELSPGEQVIFTGKCIEHPQYGKQWKMEAVEILRPTTLLGIERYLASGLIRGVGAATARLIVDHFGEETLDIMGSHPERLSEVPKIGKKRAVQIGESFLEQEQSRQAIVFLQSYGIPVTYAVKISKLYGERAPQVIRDNPYKLIDDIEGIGFKTADQIALSMGISGDSPNRICSALKYVLREAAQSGGHVYLPQEDLLERTARMLNISKEAVAHELAGLLLTKELVVEFDREERHAIYLDAFYRAEREVAKRLYELYLAIPNKKTDVSKEIASFEKYNNIVLSPLQKDAAREAMENGVTVITGGPGTGKTTLINCILSLLSGTKTVLCAPTGRAAKRMTETTGEEAKTIHRLLEYGGDENVFNRNQDNPIEADCVIVDEMSMVDMLLMRSLLRALEPGTRLIMVGDADQLPSVGAGNILGDILKSDVIPTVRLTEIFRQEGGSRIAHNAHRINRGELPLLNEKATDFFFERKASQQETLQAIVDLTASRLPKYLHLDAKNLHQEIIKNIQVLSPMKKGECGVLMINQVLQEALNPKSPGKPSLQYGDQTFRLHDKVIQTKNDYQMEWVKETFSGTEEGQGVFNGDIGQIKEVDLDDHTLTIAFDDDREAIYQSQDLENIDLAYCLSVHKSQGSEFPVVILPVVSGPQMLLTRNLFYTALTRARQLVVLCGREEIIAQMVNNNYITSRFTALALRLNEMAELYP